VSNKDPCVPWWERTTELVPYAGLLQGDKNLCVFAAVAGAVNHLLGRQAWTIDSLLEVHGEDPNTWTLAVAYTAIDPFS
jgi:cytochrome bd-type quinol oxidase subunit 1